MEEMFRDCQNLKSIDLSSFDTKNVTNMKEFFRNCYHLQTVLLNENFIINDACRIKDMFDQTACDIQGKLTIWNAPLATQNAMKADTTFHSNKIEFK